MDLYGLCDAEPCAGLSEAMRPACNGRLGASRRGLVGGAGANRCDELGWGLRGQTRPAGTMATSHEFSVRRRSLGVSGLRCFPAALFPTQRGSSGLSAVSRSGLATHFPRDPLVVVQFASPVGPTRREAHRIVFHVWPRTAHMPAYIASGGCRRFTCLATSVRASSCPLLRYAVPKPRGTLDTEASC